MKILFKREYLLILIFLYIITLIFMVKPRKAEWEKKPLPIPKEETKEITRYTKDFSFTETKNEKVIFEIYAKEVLAQKDTHLFLKNVVLTFYLKEGKLNINCESAKFDIEKKDAEISGNVLAKFPNGLNIWTENIFYQNNKGTLEGPIQINMSYQNFIGRCSSIEINIFTEIFSLKELEITSHNGFIYMPLAEGNMKNSTFYSKENIYLIYEKNILTFEEFKLNFTEEKFLISGKCFKGNFIGLKNYLFLSDEFESEFLAKDFKPAIFKFNKNLKMSGLEDNVNISSETGIFYFDNGEISTIHISENVEIENNENKIYCDVLNVYLKDNQVNNAFFGDYIILCFSGWYITCDNMNYLPKEDILLLNGRIIGSKGYIKTKSSWMKILKKGEKILFGGGVEMEEKNKGIRIKSKECEIEEKEKKAIFREKIIAWTKEYTLKSKRLEIIGDNIIAKNNAELLGLRDEENFSLKAEEIRLNQKEEKLEAIEAIKLNWRNYKIEGYFLQAFLENNKLERFILSDQVIFFTNDKKQQGKGELLDAYPDKNLMILEGCPAKLEDEAKGKIDAEKIFILKEPLEVFIIDEKTGKITYKKQ